MAGYIRRIKGHYRDTHAQIGAQPASNAALSAIYATAAQDATNKALDKAIKDAELAYRLSEGPLLAAQRAAETYAADLQGQNEDLARLGTIAARHQGEFIGYQKGWQQAKKPIDPYVLWYDPKTGETQRKPDKAHAFAYVVPPDRNGVPGLWWKRYGQQYRDSKRRADLSMKQYEGEQARLQRLYRGYKPLAQRVERLNKRRDRLYERYTDAIAARNEGFVPVSGPNPFTSGLR